MFNYLIEVLVSIADWFRFWIIMDEYEAGVVLRLGRYHRSIGPGLHFKWFIFEEEMTARTSITTMELRPQSLYTKDKTSIVVNAIIKYSVTDAKPFLLEVWDANDVLRDVTMGALRNAIHQVNYDDILSGESDIEKLCTRLVRAEVNQFGFKIYKITLTDIGTFKTIRLLQDAPGYTSNDED